MFGLRFGTRGPPVPLSKPIVLANPHGFAYGEQPLGNSGLLAFVNGLIPQRQWDRRSLVGSGIVELAVDHDGDWDNPRRTVRGELNQPECAWTFPLLGLASQLGSTHRDEAEHY